MTSLEKYNQAFMETFELTKEQLNAECSVEHISQWDSIGHITLISRLEDEFDIMMDADDIIAFHSYESGREILKRYEVEL